MVSPDVGIRQFGIRIAAFQRYSLWTAEGASRRVGMVMAVGAIVRDLQAMRDHVFPLWVPRQ